MHEEHMRYAIQLALDNVRSGKGGPFAAVIVKDNKIIAEGTNLVTATFDPTAHAEVVAIRRACATTQDFQLTDCDLYTTCEPCPMCLGAIYWARPKQIFYANNRADAAAIEFDDSFIYDEIPLPLDQRKIKMISCLREEALVVFQEWANKTDKTKY